MYEVLIQGFPGRTPRGFLGWSTTALLHTAGGPVLFDTGASGDRPSLLAALGARGIAPDDIRTIVLSHLHFDHIANVECFPRAELIIHQDELSYFYEQQGRDQALPIYQIEGMLSRSKLQLINGELELLPGVKLLRTPGHTGGHCSLMFSHGGKTVILAQDAIKHRGEAQAGVAGGAFAPDLAMQSIRRILSLADIVIPGHDGALQIEGGAVTAAEPLCEEITITLDGRTVRLEA
jgi:glyoxylase-like metal-dependent hydrolase (beta-lactamase superfamily II)